MNKNEKTALVPRLRFPEFCVAYEWGEKKLGQLLTIGNGRDYKHLSNGNIPVYGSGGYMLSVNDFLYDGESVCIGRKGTINNPIFLEGKFWTVDTLFYTHSFINCIPRFMYNIFQNIDWIKYNEASGVPSLSKTTIEKIKVFVPRDIAEQKKIADCLSSLDDLITAEDKKLEAFKAHKKGLMQKLFPAEGQTVPEWRFPEFRDSGEWEEKKFGELCKFTRGPFGGALKKEIFVKDGYAVYEQSHAIYSDFHSFRYYITKEKYDELKRFSVHADDIIMSCSGTMGKFAIVPKGSRAGVINQALLKLTINNGIDIKFAKTTLELDSNQEKILSQSAGGAIKNVVSVDQMKEIKFLMPHFPEQQKIADCLSSVDDLITEQTKKIEALKTHKKGLMQGLFPSIEEVGE